MLHLLLHRLIPKDYDEHLLGFLAIDEHLVDIGDDLVDYEVRTKCRYASLRLLTWGGYLGEDGEYFRAVCVQDDVSGNTFNIYRAYVRMYRAAAPMQLIEYITQLEGRHSKALQHLSARQQEHFHSRHKQAAVVPGKTASSQ